MIDNYCSSKIHSNEELITILNTYRKTGKTIVTLNGSFDLLHSGHLYILFEAAKQGDILVVALNSDESIQKYKSADRPIITLEHRLHMMSAIACVDFVTWFNETTPIEFLRKIKPHVHVNGAEYGENCIEAQVLKELNTKLHLVPRIEGLATSDIIKKIQSLCV